MAALIHLHVSIATFDCVEFGTHIAHDTVAHIPKIEVVRRARKDCRVFPGSVFRAIDVGRHAFPVTHRHHHLAIDDGKRFEFLFALITLRDLFRRKAGALLRVNLVWK
jgi:hypothetical protein